MAGGPAATSDPEVTSKVETARHRAETWAEARRALPGSPLPSSRAPGLWASFPRANVRRARVSPQGGRAVPAPGLAHPEARGPQDVPERDPRAPPPPRVARRLRSRLCGSASVRGREGPLCASPVSARTPGVPPSESSSRRARGHVWAACPSRGPRSASSHRQLAPTRRS